MPEPRSMITARGKRQNGTALRRAWRIYAHAIGPKPPGLSDAEADIACVIRTVVLAIPALCIIANCGRTFGIW